MGYILFSKLMPKQSILIIKLFSKELKIVIWWQSIVLKKYKTAFISHSWRPPHLHKYTPIILSNTSNCTYLNKFSNCLTFLFSLNFPFTLIALSYQCVSEYGFIGSLQLYLNQNKTDLMLQSHYINVSNFYFKIIIYSFIMKSLTKTLKNFKLDHATLPKEIRIQKTINDTPRKVTQYHYCRSKPQQRTNPHVAGLSKIILQDLDLDYQTLVNQHQTAQYLCGNQLLQNSEPITNNYCGHQFGSWAGQLGDGRAHTLGFYTNSQNKLYQLQLKGSGKTPFSRFADGNSVTSSALRQFLVSQSMHCLGVPTTRAASLIISQDLVRRDPFYDGNIKIEKAAIVLRISPSFLRFGSFQICLQKAHCYSKDNSKNRAFIQPLADFLLKNHYKQIYKNQQCDQYESMFIELTKRSAKLVARWQSVGFVHGVLNTDNMSMVGVTIDYGPFAFIDYFSKDYVSNMTDKQERYSYRRQPNVVKWNLRRLAEAFDYLVPQEILKKHIDDIFEKTFAEQYFRLMHQKLGIKQDENSRNLINSLFDIMDKYSSNFTNIFRIISSPSLSIQEMTEKLKNESPTPQLVLKYLRVFPQIIGIDPTSIAQQDQGYNVDFITSQPQRFERYQKLKNILDKDYMSQQTHDWKEWVQRYQKYNIDKQLQKRSNPRYVLRNDVASNILAELNKLDNKQQPQFLQKVLNVFYNPFEHNEWFQEKFWSRKCDPVKLTCSS